MCCLQSFPAPACPKRKPQMNNASWLSLQSSTCTSKCPSVQNVFSHEIFFIIFFILITWSVKRYMYIQGKINSYNLALSFITNSKRLKELIISGKKSWSKTIFSQGKLWQIYVTITENLNTIVEAFSFSMLLVCKRILNYCSRSTQKQNRNSTKI